jgi:hypothetical protein
MKINTKQLTISPDTEAFDKLMMIKEIFKIAIRSNAFIAIADHGLTSWFVQRGCLIDDR